MGMTREQVHDLMKNELRCIQKANSCDRDCAKCSLVKDDKELIEAYRYVIKALEQESCENAISRQAVQDYIAKYLSQYLYNDVREAVEVIDEYIGELPSVNPQPKTNKWIPVSERLPDDRDWYLGIFRESDTGWINPLPFVCDYVGHETKATTKEHWILRGFTDRDEHIDYYFNLECVAWMPLPKPYEESEE